MNVASPTIDDTRAKASALVDREWRQTYSRMLAYERVGQMVGTSASWLRKFVKGYESGLSFVVGMNIVVTYERLCERIEADADRREKNAATEGNSQVDKGLACGAPAAETRGSDAPGMD